MKRSTHDFFVFPPNKTLIWRRPCSIGQSCCSMTSKRGIGWFPESSRAWSFFTRALVKPTKNHPRLYPFDKPIKSLYFCSLVVSALFARLYFKVIRKSLYHTRHHIMPVHTQTNKAKSLALATGSRARLAPICLTCIDYHHVFWLK